MRRDVFDAFDGLLLVFFALHQVELSKGLGVQKKSAVRLSKSKLTNELFLLLGEGMQEKVEYLPVLGHCEFGLEEVLLVLGEDITLEQREVVLNEGSEVH